MTLTNHIADANHAAAAYLYGDTSESAKLARANLRIGMLERGIRELRHLLAGPDATEGRIALNCTVWGVEVTLHVRSDEDGLAWEEAWISSTRVDKWLAEIPDHSVEAAMQAAWQAWCRREADAYWADVGEERRAA